MFHRAQFWETFSFITQTIFVQMFQDNVLVLNDSILQHKTHHNAGLGEDADDNQKHVVWSVSENWTKQIRGTL